MGLSFSFLSGTGAAAKQVARPSLPLPLQKTPRCSSRRFSRQSSIPTEFISVSAARLGAGGACADEWPVSGEAKRLASTGPHFVTSSEGVSHGNSQESSGEEACG